MPTIGGLPSADAVSGSDLIPIWQAGITRYATVSEVASSVPGSIGATTITIPYDSGAHPNALKTVFNFSTSPINNSANPTLFQTNITSTTSGHEIWANFDSTIHNVPGGDAASTGNIVSRYVQAVRYTDSMVPLSALIANAIDATGHISNSNGQLSALELDITANGDDSATRRRGLEIALGKYDNAGARPEARAAIEVYSGSDTIQDIGGFGFYKLIAFASPFRDVGIDFTGSPDWAGSGTGTNMAIRFRSNQKLVLDTDANTYFRHGVTSGAVELNNIGGWGSANTGKQLVLTTPNGGSNPALGITDATGSNIWALINNSGTLNFSQMPALTNSSTAPVNVMTLTTGGAVAIGGGTKNILTTTPGANTSSPIVLQSTSGNTGGIQINPGSAGVTVSGTLTTSLYRNPVPTYATTTTATAPVALGANYTGSLTSSGSSFQYVIPADSLDTTGIVGGSGWWGGSFQHNFGGTKGSIGGLRTTLTQTTDVIDHSSSFFISPFSSSLDLEHSGGASSNSTGIAASALVYQGAAATNWGLVESAEFDISRAAGSSVLYAFTVTILNSNQSGGHATNNEALLAFGGDKADALVGSNMVIALNRGDTAWPIDPAGTIIGSYIQSQHTGATKSKPQQAAYFLDARAMNLAHIIQSPGLDVTGAGAISTGRLVISDTGTGPTLDATLYKATAVTASASGAGYVAGDQVYPSGMAGVINIDTVDGSGHVLTCSWAMAAFSASNPATAATLGGSGDGGFVASITWTLATALTLQPSGGALGLAAAAGSIGFYGATPVAKQTGVAISAAAIHAALVNLGLISA